MTDPSQPPASFIGYLQSLAQKDQRGVLSALRRGLGRPPGTATEMYRYVEPWLPPKRSYTQEAAYYQIAALFAWHPKNTNEGNLGEHYSQMCPQNREESTNDAVERRFSVLLSAHIDDLPDYLRQAISLLKSNDIPVNWEQLLRDLQAWDSPDRRVQKSWAHSFWGRQSTES